MREEHVTRAILKWLLENKWKIICFDFPQSGTGRLLHPNKGNEKNKDAINPDIVATRNGICVFFENKDRFYYPDYLKIHDLITHDDYSEAISQLLVNESIKEFYYGIGLPTNKHTKASVDSCHLVDFIIGVEDDKSIRVLHLAYPSIF